MHQKLALVYIRDCRHLKRLEIRVRKIHMRQLTHSSALVTIHQSLQKLRYRPTRCMAYRASREIHLEKIHPKIRAVDKYVKTDTSNGKVQ